MLSQTTAGSRCGLEARHVPGSPSGWQEQHMSEASEKLLKMLRATSAPAIVFLQPVAGLPWAELDPRQAWLEQAAKQNVAAGCWHQKALPPCRVSRGAARIVTALASMQSALQSASTLDGRTQSILTNMIKIGLHGANGRNLDIGCMITGRSQVDRPIQDDM